MQEEKDKIILKGAQVWNEWRRNNQSLLDFNSPSWYECRDAKGRSIKGRNKLNFGGMDLSNARIHKAFAEGLNLREAIFDGTQFEEGDFSRADFSGATFRNTKFNKTILTDANFNGTTFINCNLNRVNLTNAQFCVKEIRETVVYGISSWDLHTCPEMKQSKLVIEKTYELYSDLVNRGHVPLMVDDIELAQFIHYLTDHKKMRNMINVFNSRGVLLLGKFKDGGIGRLYKLHDWLSDNEYMPMMFDFERPDNLDLTETIVTMAGLSKFIIADLSGASVPQELYAISITFKKPIIAYSTDGGYSMFSDIKRRNPNVVHIQVGIDEELIDKIQAAIPDIERMHKTIISELTEN
jgi:uncharacterized protein YjbI with pentapeptide repeats